MARPQRSLAVSPRGLPSRLPEGEIVLWTGAPDWRVLARTALHARKLAIYFTLVAAYATVSSALSGAGPAASILTLLKTAAVGAIPVVLAVAYAWLVSRVAVYTITNRRVAMHIGLALPVTLNIPFARIAAADMSAAPDGSGDLSLSLAGRDRFAYFILWPHARPWRFAKAQPSMRGLRDVTRPAQVLGRALAAAADMTVPVIADRQTSPTHSPHATLAA